jgi:hypothetical protein
LARGSGTAGAAPCLAATVPHEQVGADRPHDRGFGAAAAAAATIWLTAPARPVADDLDDAAEAPPDIAARGSARKFSGRRERRGNLRQSV